MGGSVRQLWGVSARLAISVLAYSVVTVNGLILGVVLASPALFEQLCSIADQSPWLAALGVLFSAGPVGVSLIVDYRTLEREPWQWNWQRRLTQLAVWFSLVYLAADAAILRGPWLAGQAGSFDRVTIWTARLSSAHGGVPLTAFALTLGFGATLWCTTGALIRAYAASRAKGRLMNLRRLKVVVWLLCVLVFVAGFAGISSFATGGAG